MAQATYGTGYLSEKARLALKTPTKLREGQGNKKQYSLGWRVGTLIFNDQMQNSLWPKELQLTPDLFDEWSVKRLGVSNTKVSGFVRLLCTLPKMQFNDLL
ncbi:hypothetical protein [Pseudoalteromonas xiamenensis]